MIEINEKVIEKKVDQAKVGLIDVLYIIEKHYRRYKNVGNKSTSLVLESYVKMIKDEITQSVIDEFYFEELFADFEKAKTEKQKNYIAANMLRKKQKISLYKALNIVLGNNPKYFFRDEYDNCKKFLKRRKLSYK
ncbi:MAG: hypothetical protein HYS24_12965 [Ignavibacteriales bacterium]|nr:hypothetical protein [Ignavibacteriales bacterium]